VRENEKKMVVDVKPDAHYLRMPPYCAGGADNFQTPP